MEWAHLSVVIAGTAHRLHSNFNVWRTLNLLQYRVDTKAKQTYIRLNPKHWDRLGGGVFFKRVFHCLLETWQSSKGGGVWVRIKYRNIVHSTRLKVKPIHYKLDRHILRTISGWGTVPSCCTTCVLGWFLNQTPEVKPDKNPNSFYISHAFGRGRGILLAILPVTQGTVAMAIIWASDWLWDLSCSSAGK